MTDGAGSGEIRPFQIFAPRPAARLRLLSFPHAGAGASAYRRWARAMPDTVELVAVQLPGRENRFREAPIDDGDRLMRSLIAGLGPLLDRPFVTLGHSFGAALSLAMVRAFARAGLAMPRHMILSGATPPPYRRSEPAPMDDAALLAHLRRLRGTPDALFANAKLMRLYLPALRADLAVMRGGALDDAAAVAIGFTTLAGIADKAAPPDRLREWEALTLAWCDHRHFEGGHFFLHEHPDAMACVARICEAVIEPAGRSSRDQNSISRIIPGSSVSPRNRSAWRRT